MCHDPPTLISPLRTLVVVACTVIGFDRRDDLLVSERPDVQYVDLSPGPPGFSPGDGVVLSSSDGPIYYPLLIALIIAYVLSDINCV